MPDRNGRECTVCPPWNASEDVEVERCLHYNGGIICWTSKEKVHMVCGPDHSHPASDCYCNPEHFPTPNAALAEFEKRALRLLGWEPVSND